jgi:uncharacterized protein YggU (UPF0235/DUF167 family)
MEVHIRVIPNSRRDTIRKEGNGYVVETKCPAQHGAANRAVREHVAKEMGVAIENVIIVRGATSRKKTLLITR